MEGLNKTLSRLPIMLFAVIYCAWLWYDYHDWQTSPQSELGKKIASITTAKTELEAAKKKLATGEEFFRNLDSLRSRIRTLTAQLDGSKTTLNADIDIANFVRMITLEAKKLGLTIKGITPAAERKAEYYVEVPFTVTLRGAYVQVLVFFDRVSKFQQVIRISDFSMHPSGNVFTKYVELEGTVKLIAYKYLGTQADEVNNKKEMTEDYEKKTGATPVKPADNKGGK